MIAGLEFLVLIPLAGSLISAFIPDKEERWITRVALAVNVGTVACYAVILTLWTSGGFAPLSPPAFLYLNFGHYEFSASLFFDVLSAVFVGLTLFLTGIITKFSQYYLHREPGYSRFFSTLQFFMSGLILLSVAGNLDVLFIGWEIVGISSFLLIGFYRQRIHPVKNAVRTYAVYRLTDLGLLASIWLEHLILSHHTSFQELALPEVTSLLQSQSSAALLGITLLILLSSAGKSGQFPFSFWVPRAMEGPTPSSAVFYGALSIHAGAFLLMRTQPIWTVHPAGPWCVGGLGFVSAVMATVIGRSQSNIKAQIAFSSVTQVGLIFVELAFGWNNLALFHLVANACLRCFQLLVSPSVVVYLLRLQNVVGHPIDQSKSIWERFSSKKMQSSLYALSISEGYLEAIVEAVFWRSARSLSHTLRSPYFAPVLVAVVLSLSLLFPLRPLAFGFLAISVFFSLLAISETGSFSKIWAWLGFSNLLLAASVWFMNGEQFTKDILPFAGGVFLAWVVGFGLLAAIRSFGARPVLVGALLASLLGMAGFPPSPVFWGWDMLLLTSAKSSWVEAAGVGFVFVLNSVVGVRSYAYKFWGKLQTSVDQVQTTSSRGKQI